MALSVTAPAVTVELPSGDRLIAGRFEMGEVYLTDGLTMDLSSYLSGTPQVHISGDNATYSVTHDGGTAAAGVVKASVVANGTEVANAFNLSALGGTYIAVGTAV